MHPEEYRKLAEVEDRMWYFRALHGHVERELRRGLDPGTPARVLDAGCGTGGLIRRLGARVPAWRWTGLDLSPLACARARERTSVKIVEGSIEALPFADGEFDAVVSVDVLAHLDDPGVALRELTRCVRPGGVVVASGPAYRWLWSYHDETCHVRRRFTRGGLAGAMEAAGLRVEMSTYLLMFMFPALVLKRKVFRRATSSSDVREYPRPVDAVCGGLAAAESALIGAGWRSPFGSSALVAARRR